MTQGRYFNRKSERILDIWHIARFGEKAAKKYDKELMTRHRRTLEKRELYEEDDIQGDTVEWEMCDAISLANGMEIDYYEYWKHPSFKNEEESE